MLTLYPAALYWTHQDNKQTGTTTMDNQNLYQSLFPSVSFSDKVAVYFKDGSVIELKHLYYDSSALDQICWENVTDCHEI